MENCCVNLPETLISVPQDVLAEFRLPSDDSPTDFCDIRRRTSVTNRRKSRRSMNFTPEKVLLLAASESPVDHVSETVHEDRVKTHPQLEEIPQLFDGTFNNQGTECTPHNAECFPGEIMGMCIIPDEPTLCENKTSKCKKNRRRRQSADFEIMQTVQEVNLSPDIEMEGLDEVKKLPGSRKSRRLKRQSMELCRSVVMQMAAESPVIESPTASLTNSPAADCVTSETTDISPCQVVGPDSASQQMNNEDVIEQITEKIHSQETQLESDKKVTSGKAKKTPAKQKVSNRGRKKQKTEEPALEDIYKNKLWRTQMPKEGSWETIYEAPREGKGGHLELCSTKRLRRVLSYDDFFNKQKLKRRRQKAKALGFKPMTARKKAMASAALEVRLQDLDLYLQTEDNEDVIASTPSQFHQAGDTQMNVCLPHETNNNVSHEETSKEGEIVTSHIKNPHLVSEEVLLSLNCVQNTETEISDTRQNFMNEQSDTNTQPSVS